MGRVSIVSVIYIIIGIVIANDRGYLIDLASLPHLASALLAIILWPLVLLGVDLHLAF
jgi:hypothetical protein